MDDHIIIPPGSVLDGAMRAMAGRLRMIFLAGIPGVGKSLLLQQQALIAQAMGRTVHLLQWDVARLPFETPAIMARYPDHEGVTHAAVRKAVGLWAREDVWRWHQTHPGQEHLLVGEVPLIGNRLIELAQVHGDDVESLLASEEVRYAIPVPTLEVRQLIEAKRERSIAAPRHEREAGDAPPNVLRALWDEIYELAHRLGMVGEEAQDRRPLYDPDAYKAVYAHLLRHRKYEVLSVDTVLPAKGSAYDLEIKGSELIPTAAEVEQAMADVEGRYRGEEVEIEVANWHNV